MLTRGPRTIPAFIGFDTIEALRPEAPAPGPINLVVRKESLSIARPIGEGSVTVRVVTSYFAIERGEVLYVRTRIGEFSTYRGGGPHDRERATRLLVRACDFADELRNDLLGYGYRVRPSYIAPPADLLLLDGYPEFVTRALINELLDGKEAGDGQQ